MIDRLLSTVVEDRNVYGTVFFTRAFTKVRATVRANVRASTRAKIVARACVSAACASITLGCGNDLVSAPPVNADPATVFREVRLNHNVVNLTSAPYDTISLAVTPYNAEGTALPETNATVRFVSRDTLAMRVTSDGHVTPQKTGEAAWIVASITIGHVTKRDSARVVWLADEPTITGLSAAPVSPDSALLRNWNGSMKETPVWLSGTNLDGVLVQYELPDVSIAYMFDSFQPESRMIVASASDGRAAVDIGGFVVGQRMVRVSATVRGVTWVDSVRFTVGMPSFLAFSITERPRHDGTVIYAVDPDTMYVPIGGIASWSNLSKTQPMSIIFDDPARALPGMPWFGLDAGNITPWLYDPNNWLSMARTRGFVTPGAIQWHSPERGVRGTIIVIDEQTCLPNSCPPHS